MAQRIQASSSSCWFLRPGQGPPAAAAPGPHHYWLSTGNRFQNGGTAGALADFPSDLRSERYLRRAVHQTQRLFDALDRCEPQERRLFQLHRQPLAKGLVKYRIARLVFEIGEDDGVFGGEFWRPVKVK
jgi:hypothetical protein